MKNRRVALYVAAAVVGSDLVLLISGYRLLLTEKRISEVISPGYASHGLFIEPTTAERLKCRYFTGRSVRTVSVDAALLDECPFIYRPLPRG